MSEPVVWNSPTGGGDVPPEVGDFRMGSSFSRWALARYLVGRSLLTSLSRCMLAIGVAIFAFALALWFGPEAHGWAFLLALLAFGVLLIRALVVAVIRRLTATREFAGIEPGLRRLVAETRPEVLRELRLNGLPSHTWTLPLLGLRLLRPSKRRDTIARLRQFDVDRVVPASRVDEVHMLLRGVGER